MVLGLLVSRLYDHDDDSVSMKELCTLLWYILFDQI